MTDHNNNNNEANNNAEFPAIVVLKKHRPKKPAAPAAPAPAATAAPAASSPIYQAAYPPLSTRPPSESELRAQEKLAALAAPSDDASAAEEEKAAAIAAVAAAGNAWARFVAESLLHASDASGVRCELLVFGSRQLGVRDAASDVDAVLVAPNFCTLAHLFAHFPEQLRRSSSSSSSPLPVSEVVSVEDAMVPLLCFRLGKNTCFDLMLARAPSAKQYLGSAACGVPSRAVLLGDDPAILRAMDSHSARALAGPRGTETLLRLIQETAAPMPVFLEVLGYVRRWARARGVYGNKMGYLGGVNCAILVTLVCQLYPKSAPAALLLRFFQCFKSWKWPNPVILNRALLVKQPADPDVRLVSWSKLHHPQDLMPIITPAFPAINSSASASAQSMAVIQRELERGHAIAEAAMRGTGDWTELFAPSDFFARYETYIECRILLTTTTDLGWTGFVESRLRRLVQGLETIPVAEIQLFPIACSSDDDTEDVSYYIGLAGVSDADQLAHRLARFRATALDCRGCGGAVTLRSLAWTELPRARAARSSSSSAANTPDPAVPQAEAEKKPKKAKKAAAESMPAASSDDPASAEAEKKPKKAKKAAAEESMPATTADDPASAEAEKKPKKVKKAAAAEESMPATTADDPAAAASAVEKKPKKAKKAAATAAAEPVDAPIDAAAGKKKKRKAEGVVDEPAAFKKLQQEAAAAAAVESSD